MLKLVIRRVLESIPLLLAISFVTFFLLFHTPGSYLDQLKMDPKIPTEYIRMAEEKFGLNQPFYVVWWRWVTGIVTRGDLGLSFTYKVSISSLIGQRLLATFILALSSTLFAWLLAVPLGIIAAVKQDKLPDRFASAVAFLGLSVPSVLLALLAVYLAAVTGWFPTGGMRSDTAFQLDSNWARFTDILAHLALPTVVLGMGGLAIYTRQMRSNLLESLQADYMRTALAKGVPYRSAVWRHALRNAINPLITLFGFAFSDLLSGAFLVENVMAWPGLGRATMEAYGSKDMFMIAATVMMASVMLILGNLVADILLALNDPRIRYE